MTTHARKAIRESIVAALAAGGTSAGARVYDTPSDTRVTFPALVVEDMGERQAALTLPGGADRRIERRYEVEVSAELQQTTDYAADRDDLLADVERIMVSVVLPGVKSIVPTNYMPDLDTRGERPIAIGRQRFEVFYITTQGDPASTL